MSFEDIIKALEKQKSKKDAEDYLMSQLSSDQSKKLKEVLKDRAALEQMLSSKEAKEIMKKFTEGKNG